MSAYQRIISNNSYAHDKQVHYPKQEKTVQRCQTVTVADASISSVNVLATLT